MGKGVRRMDGGYWILHSMEGLASLRRQYHIQFYNLGLVAIARVCRIKKMPILLRVWNLDLHDFWKEVNIVEYQCSLCKCVVVPL